MTSIAVVDYGMGNLRSVLNAFELIGSPAQLCATPKELHQAERIVIPGVGAFGDGMRALRERGLDEAIHALVAEGRPLLGVCLGMQLLAARGTEFGEHEGLGLIEGSVDLIETDPDLRIPHVGWNDLDVRADSDLLRDLDDEPAFYFVHSFELRPAANGEVVTGTTDYGRPIVATVERDGVYGAQFHPEKSGRDGLQLLRSFAALPC